MVEYNISLDSVFNSLADPTRRDIVRRVSINELSVSEIATAYDMTIAAISKHLKILENARLIVKRRLGKQQLVRADGEGLQAAASYLETYERLWNDRFDRLDIFLTEE